MKLVLPRVLGKQFEKICQIVSSLIRDPTSLMTSSTASLTNNRSVSFGLPSGTSGDLSCSKSSATLSGSASIWYFPNVRYGRLGWFNLMLICRKWINLLTWIIYFVQQLCTSRYSGFCYQTLSHKRSRYCE